MDGNVAVKTLTRRKMCGFIFILHWNLSKKWQMASTVCGITDNWWGQQSIDKRAFCVYIVLFTSGNTCLIMTIIGRNSESRLVIEDHGQESPGKLPKKTGNVRCLCISPALLLNPSLRIEGILGLKATWRSWKLLQLTRKLLHQLLMIHAP